MKLNCFIENEKIWNSKLTRILLQEERKNVCNLQFYIEHVTRLKYRIHENTAS